MPSPFDLPEPLVAAVAEGGGVGELRPTLTAEAALKAVPDGWAKVNGRWVEMVRPYGRKLPYDFVEWDWGTLNEALQDGRIRILPTGVNCVCTPDGKRCATHGKNE